MEARKRASGSAPGASGSSSSSSSAAVCGFSRKATMRESSSTCRMPRSGACSRRTGFTAIETSAERRRCSSTKAR